MFRRVREARRRQRSLHLGPDRRAIDREVLQTERHVPADSLGHDPGPRVLEQQGGSLAGHVDGGPVNTNVAREVSVGSGKQQAGDRA